MDAQHFSPNVHNARAVSTSEESVSQRSTLIIHKVHVDGIATPLRALVYTGASKNFVREQVVNSHGLNLSDSKQEISVRLANGTTVKMPKRVICLAIEFKDF